MSNEFIDFMAAAWSRTTICDSFVNNHSFIERRETEQKKKKQMMCNTIIIIFIEYNLIGIKLIVQFIVVDRAATLVCYEMVVVVA